MPPPNPAPPPRCDIADATQKGNIEALIGCNTQDSGELTPVVDGRESDSANLDRSLELIVRAGNSPMAGLMTLVPQVTSDELTTLATESPDVAAFYEYFAGLQEAWDGPAAILFSDGRYVGATLDRNGLRPARFTQTKSGLVYVMSETGVCDIDDADVLRKGRLGPGEMICVDLEDGAVRTNGDIKSFVAAQRPYVKEGVALLLLLLVLLLVLLGCATPPSTPADVLPLLTNSPPPLSSQVRRVGREGTAHPRHRPHRRRAALRRRAGRPRGHPAAVRDGVRLVVRGRRHADRRHGHRRGGDDVLHGRRRAAGRPVAGASPSRPVAVARWTSPTP